MRILCSLLLALLFAGAGTVRGKEVEVVTPVAQSPFDRGTWELGFTAGYLYSPVFATSNRPAFSYLQQDLTLGLMLNSPAGPGIWRGNWEVLLNAAVAEVVQGPGNYLAGGRVLLRYNFVQENARWVPFIQLGAGGLASDAYRDNHQRILGSAFSFTLVGDIGIRYMVNSRWSVLVMFDYEHISNANRANRNLGVNALGGMIGVSTFF